MNNDLPHPWEKRKLTALFIGGLLLTFLAVACAQPEGAAASADSSETTAESGGETTPPVDDTGSIDRETMSQVSTLGALASGIYDGFLPIEEVYRRGDFGLGTFEHLDGEMVQVADGIFRVDAEGKAHRPDPSTRTPFFATTFFEPDHSFELDGEVDFAELQSRIDENLPNIAVPWAIRIEGTFSYVKTRSVPAQKQPYPPLSKVVETQPTFEFENIQGTLVGIRLPTYLGDVNLAGHHFHFIDAERTTGGHVLALRASDLTVESDETANFEMTLPASSDAFRTFASSTGE